MAGRFSKPTVVRPSRLFAVADRRFDDAVALCETGDNARANGAQYLAGLVIDISLKAQLLMRYPEIGRLAATRVSDQERFVWNLVWRSHSLDAMLNQLPDLISAIEVKGQRAGKPYFRWLSTICSTWTVAIRYSSATSQISEARVMIDRVRELKEVLR